MLVGLALLGPNPPPPGSWEQGFIAAARTQFSGIKSWEGLLAALRQAAGMEEDEQLPEGLWVYNLVVAVGRLWGVQPAEVF